MKRPFDTIRLSQCFQLNLRICTQRRYLKYLCFKVSIFIGRMSRRAWTCYIVATQAGLPLVSRIRDGRVSTASLVCRHASKSMSFVPIEAMWSLGFKHRTVFSSLSIRQRYWSRGNMLMQHRSIRRLWQYSCRHHFVVSHNPGYSQEDIPGCFRFIGMCRWLVYGYMKAKEDESHYKNKHNSSPRKL